MNVPVIKNNKRTYQICTCCVMDTSDSNIVFDENGVCGRCNEFKSRIEPEWNHGLGHEKELEELIADIKRKGKALEFAEIVAGTVLAGELSLIGALAAGHLARAHQELGRG